jgi:DNA repair exonuclease SbcCD ATPase subunit
MSRKTNPIDPSAATERKDPMTALVVAQANLTAAQNALDEALETGKDTAHLRATRDTARAEVERLEAVENAREAETRARDAAEIRRQTNALVEKALSELREALTQVRTLPDPPEPALSPDPALRLILARRASAGHTAKVEAHAKRVRSMYDRLNDREGERADIVERGAAGDCRDGDEPALALLDADIEGLRDLIARTALDKPGEDASGVSEAERAWDETILVERRRLLKELADALDARLSETVEALRAAGGRWPETNASRKLPRP